MWEQQGSAITLAAHATVLHTGVGSPLWGEANSPPSVQGQGARERGSSPDRRRRLLV